MGVISLHPATAKRCDACFVNVSRRRWLSTPEGRLALCVDCFARVTDKPGRRRRDLPGQMFLPFFENENAPGPGCETRSPGQHNQEHQL